MIFSQDTHQKIHFYLLLLVAFLMSWLQKPALSSISFVLLSLHFLLSGNWAEKWQNAKKNQLLIASTGLYLFTACSYFWSSNKEYAISELQVQLNLLGCPIVIGCMAGLTERKVKLILLTFVVSVTLGTFWNLGNSLYENYQTNHFQTLILEYYQHHHLDHFVRHGGYLSAYLLSCITALLYFLERDTTLKKYKILVGIWIGYLSANIFLLSFLMGILSFLVIMSIWFGYYLYKYHTSKYFFIFIVGIFVVVMTLMTTKNELFKHKVANSVSFFEKVSEGDTLYKKNAHQVHLIDGTTLRYIIWNLTLKDASQYYLTGVGIGDTGGELLAIYKKNDFYFGYRDYTDRSPFNCHNQFIESFFALGIIGLLLFITILLICLKQAFLERNKLLFIITLIFTMFSLVESILAMQAGVQAFGFLLSIAYIFKPSTTLN